MPDQVLTLAGANRLLTSGAQPTHLQFGSVTLPQDQWERRTVVPGAFRTVEIQRAVVAQQLQVIGADDDDAAAYTNFACLGTWIGNPTDAGSVLMAFGSAAMGTTYGSKELNNDLEVAGNVTLSASQLGNVTFDRAVVLNMTEGRFGLGRLATQAEGRGGADHVGLMTSLRVEDWWNHRDVPFSKLSGVADFNQLPNPFVTISSGLDLAADTPAAIAIPGNGLPDFRALAVAAGPAGLVDESFTIRPQLLSGSTPSLIALLGDLRQNRVRLQWVNRLTGVLTPAGNWQAVNAGRNTGGVSLAEHRGTPYAIFVTLSRYYQLYSVDVGTGALTAIGNRRRLAGSGAPSGIGLSEFNGALYALVCRSSGQPRYQLYSVDVGTGALTATGSSGITTGIPGGIGLAGSGGTLYAAAASGASRAVQIFTVNVGTGAIASAFQISDVGVNSPTGIDLQDIGGTLYLMVAGDQSDITLLHSVDTAGRTATTIGTTQELGNIVNPSLGLGSAPIPGIALGENMRAWRVSDNSIRATSLVPKRIHSIIGFRA